MILTKPHIDETIQRCLKGDQRAQMEIYRKYYKAMFNTALRIVKDPEEAEDIMQESFLSAFDKLHTFQGSATFGSWLKRIVVNRSLNSFSKSSKYTTVSYEDQFNGHTYENEEQEGISEESLASEKLQEVMTAMNSLKESYRLILTLHLIEGFDYEEVCEILNITPANCRTSISRAKESLRKKLMSYGK